MLHDVFQRCYDYQCEEWKIPSVRSHISLATRLLTFISDYESKNNLLIVYYGGYGGIGEGRHCVWSWSVFSFLPRLVFLVCSPLLVMFPKACTPSSRSIRFCLHQRIYCVIARIYSCQNTPFQTMSVVSCLKICRIRGVYSLEAPLPFIRA